MEDPRLSTRLGRLRRQMARYLVQELDRLAGPDYHPAARAAVLDCGREWLAATEGPVIVETLEVLVRLRAQADLDQRACARCGQAPATTARA